MISNFLSKFIRTLLSYLFLELLSCLKFNYIVGSRRLFFSAINCTAGPVVRGFHGLGAFALFVTRRLCSFYIFGGGLFNPLVYYIPTLISSAYWFSSSKLIRLGLPMLCMVLFVVHPLGNQVFIYSWFWFIPMVIHYIPYRAVFLEALGTTFLAHAIGSVLWLYLVPMPAAYWIGLIPVVVVERLLFASGMTMVYYGSSWMGQKLEKYENNPGVFSLKQALS